ncbi:hypothetical protein [Sporolactobacillus sp. KGMB 08714]|uniref:hypothetical protein n=1 Tax=Sporolactobacillus sp. KGMB 08714 TaxID=3064704 RepID=UPI002FBE2F70
MSAKKYTKKQINETKILLRTYFEAHMESPEDCIHEILLAYCEANKIYQEQLPLLHELSEANRKILALQAQQSGQTLEAQNKHEMEGR